MYYLKSNFGERILATRNYNYIYANRETKQTKSTICSETALVQNNDKHKHSTNNEKQ